MELSPGPVMCDDTTQYWAAHIPSTRWNGFLTPLFSGETICQIANDMAAIRNANRDEMPYVLSWSHTGKRGFPVLVLSDDNYEGEDEEIQPTMLNGVPHYALGAYSWTWSRVGRP